MSNTAQWVGIIVTGSIGLVGLVVSLTNATIARSALRSAERSASAAERSAATADRIAARSDVGWAVIPGHGSGMVLVHDGRDPAFDVHVTLRGAIIRVDGEVDHPRVTRGSSVLTFSAPHTLQGEDPGIEVTWYPRPGREGEQQSWVWAL